MRVAFLTPMQERSAIAGVSLQVIGALRHRWDIDIWYPACDRPRWTTVPTTPFVDGEAIEEALRGYDLVVHVLGDSPFHLEILRAARVVPGLVILHDWSLTNLFALLDQDYGTDLRAQVADLTSDPGARQALPGHPEGPTHAGELVPLQLATLLPMTQVALQHSLGVITHSRFAADQVSAHSPGPVLVAPLPVVAGPVPGTPVRGDGDVLLVVAGLVNVNKCVDRLVEAIGASDLLRSRLRLRVVGACSVPVGEALLGAAAAAGVADRVELRGSLPREEFHAALAEADAFACLRDPVLEAGSASLLEEMATGRPVVVYDHGHYAEMPDDAVRKVDPAGGQEELVAALEALVRDPDAARRTGSRGREHVVSTHHAAAYVVVLLGAARVSLEAQPLGSGLGRLLTIMDDLGLADDAYARARVGSTVAELFT